jgi:uncharacterized protein (TIGR00297 family)
MTETFAVIIFILFICAAGFILNSLTASGAVAAFFTGVLIYAGFGSKGLVLLGVFFATSSLWSKYKSVKKLVIEQKLAKGSRRDWRQVAANGGAAALFSIVHYFDPQLIWLIGFAVCLSSANSDTWASEIGTLSTQRPIYIRTFKRVDKGTSGAVSLLGTVAAVSGALLIAICSLFFFHLSILNFLMIFLFGFMGNIIDTIIGAFYQIEYICPQCGIVTERRHHCNKSTKQIKGMPFIDNDMVNFLSGFVAALFAMGLVAVI